MPPKSKKSKKRCAPGKSRYGKRGCLSINCQKGPRTLRGKCPKRKGAAGRKGAMKAISHLSPF